MKYLSFIFTFLLACNGSFHFLSAQSSQNLSLQSNWSNPNLPSAVGIVYNEVWGWADSTSGREYAIIGTLAETYFIEVTDPQNPVVRDSVPGGFNNAIHRDFKTYRHYCYGVADEGQTSTLQIFDLSYLPDSVHLVYDSSEFFVRAHNIFIEEAAGRLYAVGTNNLGGGVIVLDLAGNPEQPVLAGQGYYNLGSYTHDLYVRGDTLYMNNATNGLSIWDFSNLSNPDPLGTLTNYPNAGYNHSGWLTESGDHLVMCDETHNRPVRMVDVTNTGNPQIATEFRSALLAPNDTASIPHNPLVIGDYACISYYHDGVQIYDVSNPLQPVRAGYFDTHLNHSTYNGFAGCWGVYPYLPSGNILASDVLNGLYVLRPDFVFPRAVTASVQTSTVCSGQPTSGTATALPGGGIGPYSYLWSTGDTTQQVGGLGQGIAYSVTVFDLYGYNSVANFSLTGGPPWSVQAIVNDESCLNSGDGNIALTISGATPPYTILWSTGDATDSINGLTTGQYTGSITDSLGCVFLDTFNLGFQNATPVAQAGADTSLCIRNVIMDALAPSAGQGTWQILNGNGLLNNPNDPQSVVTALGEGLNTFVWVVANGLCTDADTVSIYVSSAAFVDAGPDTLVCGDATQLQAAIPLSGNGTWSGPAGLFFTSPTDPQATVTGLPTGVISLVWQVADSGCLASDQVVLTVEPLPEADFSSSANNLQVNFTDASLNASSWFWTFGDGNTSSQQNPTHFYSNPGTYQVCLVVSDTCGSDSICRNVSLNCPAAQPAFTFTDSFLTVDFSNTSQSSFGSPSFFWDFGDNTTSTQVNPSHTYASEGTYQVCLTVSDSCGNTTICDTVSLVCAPPVANYTFFQGFDSVAFQNTSVSIDSNASYFWTFGDGDTSVLANPSHAYFFQGIYQVCLTITDVCGTDSICQEVPYFVAVGLEAGLMPQAAVHPNPVQDQFVLSLQDWSGSQVDCVMMDVQGRVLDRFAVDLIQGVGKAEKSTQGLAAGVYFLQVTGEGQVEVLRVLRE